MTIPNIPRSMLERFTDGEPGAAAELREALLSEPPADRDLDQPCDAAPGDGPPGNE